MLEFVQDWAGIAALAICIYLLFSQSDLRSGMG